ncbi:ACC oxidase 1 [Actinidia rufa]|uniref:ACC oxidase 1 n=1 Tax=Actinidia rufa TaxID=165716 RepID=A0A7J0ESW4_9ERIC|nr:ACC oxidase 1 [Actinidia rufa]
MLSATSLSNHPVSLISLPATPTSPNPKEFAASEPEDLSIPIIDFSLLTSGDPNCRTQIIQDLGKACEKWGFFMVIECAHTLPNTSTLEFVVHVIRVQPPIGYCNRVVNHGVPESLMKGVITACDEFFNLREEEKEEFEGKHELDPIRCGTSFHAKIDKVFYWRDFVKAFVHPEFHFPDKPTGFRKAEMGWVFLDPCWNNHGRSHRMIWEHLSAIGSDPLVPMKSSMISVSLLILPTQPNLTKAGREDLHMSASLLCHKTIIYFSGFDGGEGLVADRLGPLRLSIKLISSTDLACAPHSRPCYAPTWIEHELRPPHYLAAFSLAVCAPQQAPFTITSRWLGGKTLRCKSKNPKDERECSLQTFYPPCPQPQLAMGLPPHSDHGILTLLIQNEVGGLQLKHNGEWVHVTPVPNSILVNTGDHLEILSNGRYKSVLHRAVVNKNTTRISLAMANGPSLDSVVSPALELLDGEGQLPAYLPMKYKDYLKLQQSNHLDGKACLDRVRI